MISLAFILSNRNSSTALALSGFVAVLVYYLFITRKLPSEGWWLIRDQDYPFVDSRYWTGRRYLLLGVVLSVFFVCLTGQAVATKSDFPGLAIFGSLLCAAAFGLLAIGHIFLFRHWIEFFRDAAGRTPKDSHRYELADQRLQHLNIFLWSVVGVSFALGLLEKFGIRIDFSSPLLLEIYRHLFWFGVVAVLVIVWTSQNAAALLVRFILLLVFSAIMIGGASLLGWWLVMQSSIWVVIWPTAMLSLNFIFHFRVEARNIAPPSGIAASATS